MMLQCVSLFSGAGGFCEGFKLAGWKVLCGVEADTQACLTHAENFNNVPLFRSKIELFLREEQEGTPGLKELISEKIDVVYGGLHVRGLARSGRE